MYDRCIGSGRTEEEGRVYWCHLHLHGPRSQRVVVPNEGQSRQAKVRPARKVLPAQPDLSDQLRQQQHFRVVREALAVGPRGDRRRGICDGAAVKERVEGLAAPLRAQARALHRDLQGVEVVLRVEAARAHRELSALIVRHEPSAGGGQLVGVQRVVLGPHLTHEGDLPTGRATVGLGEGEGREVLEEGGDGVGRTPPPPMVPPNPVPEAPEKILKIKSSCAKGAEENFASNSGRGGGGGGEGVWGGGGSRGGPPPPILWLSAGLKHPWGMGVFGVHHGPHRPQGHELLESNPTVPWAALTVTWGWNGSLGSSA